MSERAPRSGGIGLYALRTFRREPAFAAGVVLTFAIAIGANAAMFGLVERLMLAPPPGVRDAERVMRVRLTFAAQDGESFTVGTMSYPAFRTIAALGGAFDAVAAERADSVTVGRGTELAEVAAVQASGEYFGVLGVRPALGRFFGPGDDELPAGSDVVVLGHAYWQQRFAGDPDVLGRRVIVDDQALTIVGVAPRGFNGAGLAPADLFVPLTTASRTLGAGWWRESDVRIVSILARLRDGGAAPVASEMVTAALREKVPGRFGDRIASTTLESLLPGRAARQSPQGRIALWLSGVSVVVLLIATANAGTLFLLRAARRRRDVAVRIALGASTSRLARQSLVESLLLALTGCALAVLLSRWLTDVVRVTLLPNLAASDGIADGRVLIASIVAACVAGALAALGSITRIGRRNLSGELRAGDGHGSSGRFVVQHALVALQVTLCMVLLVGAGLFVRSLQRVQSQDLGFSTARLLHVRLDFRQHLPAIERDAAHEEAARRVATLPGVTATTVVQGMPFSSHHIPPISIPGHAAPPNVGGQIPIMYAATPAYLEMMGVTLREGRFLTEADGAGAPLVVLVNETMARTVWPGQRALGKCVRAGFGASPGEADPMTAAASLPCREVVGVVRDSRARSLRLDGNEGRLMQYYVPFPQVPTPPFPDVGDIHAILVRTAESPARMAATVQRVIQGTSPVPVFARVRPYQELIDPQLRSWRLGATLFSALGGLALGIAALGLFAVVSYLVAQRTREIGVRLALGATAAHVARLVVWDAVRMVAIGVGAGTVLALAGAPLVQSMLFQTSARELTTMVAAAATLFAVTVCAAALPAWRASRVSPMTVLRTDA